MKPREFVARLAEAAPKTKDLEKLGLDAAAADDFLKVYRCVPRESPLKIGNVAGSEDLIELFTGWDIGGVQVGAMEFLSVPVATERGLQIGVEEIHPLLISHGDGEVVVDEYGIGHGHRLSEVASGGNALLDALAKAAAFFGKRVVGAISFDDFAAAKDAARDCAESAGGKRYLRFFTNFLGAEG